MMSALYGAKTASIHKVVRELAERPDWNEDRQTDGFSALYIDSCLYTTRYYPIQTEIYKDKYKTS